MSSTITTISNICGISENKDAFFTYEGTKKLILLNKMNRTISYSINRDELLRQLAHIKAVENDNYEESPYHELSMHDHNILIHRVLQRLYHYKNQNKKWYKTVQFFQLQLEHGIAMEESDRRYIHLIPLSRFSDTHFSLLSTAEKHH